MFGCDTGSAAIKLCRERTVAIVANTIPRSALSQAWLLCGDVVDERKRATSDFGARMLDALDMDEELERRARQRDIQASPDWLGSSAVGSSASASATEHRQFTLGTTDWEFTPKPVARQRRRSSQKKSPLTVLLERNSPRDPGDVRSRADMAVSDSVIMSVFFGSSRRRHSVRLTVAASATVEDVLTLALEMRAERSSQHIHKPKWNADPRAWLLRAAEDDGTPDDDLPALRRELEIGAFKGYSTFALCRNPSFEEEVGLEQQAQEDALLSAGILRISLPHTACTVSVRHVGSMSLEQVLEELTRKGYSMPRLPFGFQLLDAASTEFLSWDMLLSELPKDTILQLVNVDQKNSAALDVGQPTHNAWLNASADIGEESETPSFRRSSSFHSSEEPKFGTLKRMVGRGSLREKTRSRVTLPLPESFVFTPTSAAAEQSYSVVRLSKLGSRKEVLMTIDSTAIRIRSKHSAQGLASPSFGDEEPIKNILSAECIPETTTFWIEYKNGRKERFESSRASEIVGKIKYLKT
jgi:SAPK-interacting protein 1 (Sin1), middle CRIM domain